MLFITALIVGIVALLAFFGARRSRDGSPAARFTPALVALLAFVFAASQGVAVIPAGHVGVVDFFGNVSDQTLRAGMNLANPLARIVKMSVQTQEVKEVMDVPSKEGLSVELEVSALFHLNPDKAPEVYRSVGENYVEVILIPNFRSVARGVTASFDARALYTAERELLTQTILKELRATVEPRGIEIESTPLRKVGLPADLTRAIEEKLRAEQESQRMQFVLEKEKLEAERKRIEAQGIADFQQIVAQGISDQLLRWKGIEATEKLAGSQNAKVVVVGSGKDGLPLILGSP